MICQKVTINELHARQQKLNDRTGFEWQIFMSEYGERWDALSIEGKEKAIELSTMQSVRQIKQVSQYIGE